MGERTNGHKRYLPEQSIDLEAVYEFLNRYQPHQLPLVYNRIRRIGHSVDLVEKLEITLRNIAEKRINPFDLRGPGR